MKQHDLAVASRPLLDFSQHPQNANNGDVEAIAQSIARNGVYAPMVVQRSTGFIVKGNHTWAALLSMGLHVGPFIVLDLTDDEAKRIMVADNRTARLGRDDEGLLYELLQEIMATDAGLEGSGYDFDDYTELERLIFEPLEHDEPPEIDDDTAIPVDNAVNKGVEYEVVAIANDDDGRCYEISIFKKGGRHLTPGDYNRLLKALGQTPLTKQEIRDLGVPEWEKVR